MSGPPLKILQILRAPVGGLFRHVADLTRELAARGHDIGIVVDILANDAQTEELLRGLDAHARLGIHRLPMPRLFGKGDLTTPFAVTRLARRLEVDIIHGHGAKGGFYARLALYGRTRAKAVYTPHGGVLHYAADSRSGRLFHQIERLLMARTSAIIFESAYAEKTYTALIGAPTCPAEIIHNGLRPEEFEPVPAAADAADFVFVGELRTLKGIFPLVEALATVPGAKLVMAGDGPERMALEARIAELGLADRVRLVGSQPARRVFTLGRCVIVPSLAESLPYVVLEAAAARLPLIATRVGGIPEIFGPMAASLVPAGDSAALAKAMQEFIDSPAQSEAAMLQLLAHIEARFSVRRMTDAIEETYRAGLEKTGA
ncbi:glycosyltransferase family 4 protein [Devosia sp. YIM 151766]|uniref:glycosyltransferase family 4 protein n=1 Tax=Devosia sp. YIM 151766 TaxID=3017325 RepID=UPI00255CD923|nr:glycosyltransferase family 4 protein [Devosia sp. YIM 151766]WIY54033.1 glycosyltransferase family 4 protein [Devosia sp. YIM 151766]